MQYYEKDKDPDGFYNSSAHDIAKVLNQGDARGSSSGQVEAEYLYDDNEMSSQPAVIDGGYVLPPQDRNNAGDVEQPATRPHNKKKPAVSGVYDEDHYALARNSGFDSNFTNGSKHGNKKQKNKKRIIIAISVILGMFAIGGVCAYIVTLTLGIVIYHCYEESYKAKFFFLFLFKYIQ